MFSLGMLQIKEGLSVFNPVTKKIHLSLDVCFMEKQRLFNKNHLHGKNIAKEDHFWQVFKPLPKLILSPILYERQE